MTSGADADWKKRAEAYNRLEWVSKDGLLRAMVETAGDVSGKRVLDAGTGTAKVIEAFAQSYPDAQYFGVDISSEMLSRVRPDLPMKRVLGNIENLDFFPEACFDLVTARMVFHHVEDICRGASEIHRVLKPGGRFILCEGNPPDIYSGRFYTRMFRLKEKRHTFFESDLINLLVRTGFVEVTTRTVILRSMSLANWLSNSGLSRRRTERIWEMHRNCDERVKQAYNMQIGDGDILMDWKFSVVSGAKDRTP